MPSTPAPTIPMSMLSVTVPSLPLNAPIPAFGDLYRMNVDEYERLAEAEVLVDRRVELIGGYLVRKMTTKPPHIWTVDAVRERLERLVPDGWYVREEKPVRIPEFDEPEPDLAIVLGTRDRYADRHPGPDEVGLLIEVADSSLARDPGPKLAAYAHCGIPIYWIVNLVDRQVEVFTNPRSDGLYSDCQIYRPGEQVPVVIAGSITGQIAVAEILPPSASPSE
jgi:Uma2 family endonuclease